MAGRNPENRILQEKFTLEEERLQILKGVVSFSRIRDRVDLDCLEKRLDDIQKSLGFSQKIIQEMKSMFGFVKNYFCGKSGEQAPDPSSEDLEHSFSTSEMTAHPIPLASRMNNTTRSNRGLEVHGIPEDDLDKVKGRHLDEIGSSLARLYDLECAVDEELATQNEMLDHLRKKSAKTESTNLYQTKERSKLLKKSSHL